MKIKTFITMDYDELDSLVGQHYGNWNFSCVASEEWSNDSSYGFDVKKEELFETSKKDLEELIAGKTPMYAVGTILTDLVNRDILKEGEYLIEVSW